MNENLILIISNLLTGISTYWMGKRKSNAETDNLILTNLEKSMTIYAELVKNLKQEIHELNTKIQELESKVDSLMAENKKLKSRYSTGIKESK
jgi:peptidoglycan hydrolase CwlO-like protein